MTAYLSYAEQSLHYFSRPHEKPLRTPLGGAAAWRGPQMSAQGDWRIRLNDAKVGELDTALAAARASGKPTVGCPSVHECS